MRRFPLLCALLLGLALGLAGCSVSAGPAQGYELGGLRRVILFQKLPSPSPAVSPLPRRPA